MTGRASSLFVVVAVVACASAANNDALQPERPQVGGGTAAPNWHGCLSNVAKALPYCSTALDVDERVYDLISRMPLSAKLAAISPQRDLGSDTCGDHTRGYEAVGLPDYFWLVETNTAVAATCMPSDEGYYCPTTFVGPMGMGSSFNATSWKLKGQVLGRELRAFANAGWHRHNSENLVGITGFGPNINIARDPRFGRTSELPSEDPFHSGKYGAAMLQGMQTPDKAGHPLMVAYLKHFAAYSSEENRGHDSYDISAFDLFDTYLSQYELAFKEGHAAGVMCSYNAINGRPSCFNDFLLNEVMRKRWNQPWAHVTTDCGAVSNARGAPLNAPDDAHAAAWAINNGTDLEMGSTVWTTALADAVAAGYVSEEAVDAALARGLHHHFRAGRFDPIDQVEWARLPMSVVNSSEHQRIANDAALQSMILLKNEKAILPLGAGHQQIAVIGPMGVDKDLMSDYAGAKGESGCWPDSGNECVVTIGEAIAHANAGADTSVVAGVDVNSDNATGIAAAVAAADAADVVVLVLGNDRSQEHEGIDRHDTALAGLQPRLASEILAVGKPVVLVLSNGGALAIDDLIDGCDAIVEAFNPGINGATALADLLFGHANRWGRLPVTMYPHSFIEEENMTNYDMTAAPGRTHRYYQGEPLFPFGWGLTYSDFHITCGATGIDADASLWHFDCQVANLAAVDGDAVILVYHKAGPDVMRAVGGRHKVPSQSLVAFERVFVAANSTASVNFALTDAAWRLTDETGGKRLYPGKRSLVFKEGSKEAIVDVNIS